MPNKKFNILDMPADLVYLNSKALEAKMKDYIVYLQKMNTSDLDDTCELLKVQIKAIDEINQVRNYKLEEENKDKLIDIENEKKNIEEIINNAMEELEKINCDTFKDCIECPLFTKNNNGLCVKGMLELLIN